MPILYSITRQPLLDLHSFWMDERLAEFDRYGSNTNYLVYPGPRSRGRLRVEGEPQGLSQALFHLVSGEPAKHTLYIQLDDPPSAIIFNNCVITEFSEFHGESGASRLRCEIEYEDRFHTTTSPEVEHINFEMGINPEKKKEKSYLRDIVIFQKR